MSKYFVVTIDDKEYDFSAGDSCDSGKCDVTPSPDGWIKYVRNGRFKWRINGVTFNTSKVDDFTYKSLTPVDLSTPCLQCKVAHASLDCPPREEWHTDPGEIRIEIMNREQRNLA